MSLDSKLDKQPKVTSSASLRRLLDSSIVDINVIIEFPDPEEPPVEEPPAVNGSFSNDFNNDFN